MKKKIYFGIVSTLLFLFCFSTIVFAEPEKYQIGDNVYCYVEESQYDKYDTLVIEGTGDTYDYYYDGYDTTGKHKIPTILTGNKIYNLNVKDGVTSLGNSLLTKTYIKRIEHFSNNLKKIGSCCFLHSRENINYELLPQSIEEISEGNTFNIIFPNKLKCLSTKVIENNFYTSENITHISISYKTESILFNAFFKLRNLQICEIPPSVKYIDRTAFRNTENLTIKGYTNSYAYHFAKEHNIKFESTGMLPDFNAVYSIGNYKYRFHKNKEELCVAGLSKKGKNIKSISIPSTVTLYGKKYKVVAILTKAFYKNKNISNVTLGENVYDIGKYSFASCPKLRTVKINCSNIKYIRSRAFYKNKNLTVQLPKKKYSKYKSMIAKSGIDKKTKYVKF